MTAIHPQFIRAGTEELVVITRAEFDLLMAIASRDEQEDAEDIAVFDTRMAELKAGADAALPAAVSRLVLGGDGLLTALCRWRGMTPDDLAARAGLSLQRVADLQAGRSTADPDEARRIGEALAIDPRWLA